MKKLTLAMRIGLVVLALAVGAVASREIAAKREVQFITESVAHAEKMEVSLYIFGDAESITVTDPAELEKIITALSAIQYKGLYKGRNYIEPSDRACSIHVVAQGTHATMTLYPSGQDQASYITEEPLEPGLVIKGAYAVITLYLSDHAQSSYITGEPLDTALKNTDALYETIWSFFE